MTKIEALGAPQTRRTARRIHERVHENKVKHPSVFAMCNGRCWYCGVELNPSPGMANSYAVDHAYPRVAGGDNRIYNYLPSCSDCNTVKGGRSVEEFRRRLAWSEAGVKPMELNQILWLADNGIDVWSILPEITFYGEAEKGNARETGESV